MATQVTMPQLSDTMSEGKILTWLKHEGDSVSRGDALAEVQTDKADLEIEAFHEGVLLKIEAPIGTMVKVGSVIAVIGEKGEALPRAATSVAAAQPSPFPNLAFQQAPMAAAQTPLADERLKISPLARNIANVHAVDLTQLHGTGEGGRIVRKDIEQYMNREVGSNGGNAGGGVGSQESEVRRVPVPAATWETSHEERPPMASSGVSTEPLSSMRQTIAKRMVESVTTIPHFYITAAVMMDEAVKLKDSLQPLPQYQGITFTHLMVKAAALALKVVPTINARYDNGNLVQPKDIHVGIVTAVTGGLLIPVLKHADKLTLAEIVGEGRSLIQRARAGRPKADDLMGGTFSISNMGMFTVENFTAIINPGQGAILAVSAIQDQPVVRNGQIQPGRVMRVTLSVDHRIIDGVIAGEFLTELKRILEDPVLLLA